MYGDENLDWKWFYEVKEVDRRLSYPLVAQSSVVCDVGGAKGIDAFAFAEKGAFVINLDINKQALCKGKELARECGLNSELSFIKASATHLPFKSETLDLITCFSTLDHLPDKRSVHDAIGEFSRVIRQNAHVAITVPNKVFLIGTIIMKIKDFTDKESFFEQRFTPKELFEILSKCGLTPIKFDSEFPKNVSSSILLFNFPKICKKIPGIMTLLFFGAVFFRKITKINQTRLFGARMGYLSIKCTRAA
jgi:ubiquinone/menaquinone biosynthesis C-methylase UbiE